jgi:predicted nicotinamide N-methyase
MAAEIDPFAEHAIHLNSIANQVYVDVLLLDLLAGPAQGDRYDVILVGDLFYERDTAARTLAFLEAHAARGARVLIGDPGRTYLPKDKLTRHIEYSVPVTRELEDFDIKRTAVWGLK